MYSRKRSFAAPPVPAQPPPEGSLPAAVTAARALRVPIALVVVMGVDAVASRYLYASGEHAILPEANTVLPLLLLAACACGAALFFWRSPLAVWAPMPWFLTICAVYYGFGPLLFVFGNAASIRYAEAYYPLDQFDLIRTNLLNAVSIGTVCIAYSLFSRFFQPLVRRARTERSTANVRLLAVLAVTAVPIKYGILLPWSFGMLSGAPPSSIATFGMASLLVILLLWYEGLGTRRKLLWLAVPFTILELITSALTFSKETLLLTVFMIVLAIFLRYSRPVVLLGGALFVVAVYFASVPIVSNARYFYGESSTGGLGDRVNSGMMAASGSSANVLLPDAQAWWTRVSYANAQAFAMNAYDSGQPGHTFENAAFTFVPRFLWPDKPITSPGTDFNKLVLGYDTSASSPGVFAEAYWNGGWGMVLVVCALLGLLFAWAGYMAIAYMSRGDFRWLVCGFFTILMALRPDDWFILAFVTPFLAYVAYFLAIRLVVPDKVSQGA